MEVLLASNTAGVWRLDNVGHLQENAQRGMEKNKKRQIKYRREQQLLFPGSASLRGAVDSWFASVLSPQLVVVVVGGGEEVWSVTTVHTPSYL